MSQQLFRHTLLATNFDVFREFAKLARGAMRDHIIQTAQECIIVVIDRTQQDIDILLREAPWRLLPFPGGGRIDDLDTGSLVDSLEVVQIPEGVDNPFDSNTTANVMNELATRTEDKDIIIRRLQDKVERYNALHPNDAVIQSMPKAVACGLAEALDLDFVRKILSRASKAFIRQCFRSPQDGKRVSRQKHEWDYVRGESAQWQQMVDAVKWFDDNSFSGGEALSNANVPLDVEGYTYGNFVDLPKCRKAVAAIRKVRRLVRKANVREILSLVGQDVEQLTTDLVRSIDFTEQINELTAYFGD